MFMRVGKLSWVVSSMGGVGNNTKNEEQPHATAHKMQSPHTQWRGMPIPVNA